MGIGVSLFLIALGAILAFAVDASVSGIEIQTVGIILMIVGVIGLLITLLWLTAWSDRRRGTVAEEPVERRTEVVREREPR